MKLPPYPNPATRGTVTDREVKTKEEKAAQEAYFYNLAQLGKMPQFREVLKVWFSWCHLDDPISAPRTDDMNRRLGHRDIGLAIKKELDEADPDLYHLIDKEIREAENREGKNA